MEGLDRRESKRVFFTLEENIGVVLFPPDNPKKPFEVNLLSLSTGGISFAANKKQRKNIQEGDRLMISRIGLPAFKDAETGIEIEILYIMQYKDYDVSSVGCKFLGLTGLDKEKIEKYVEQRLVLVEEDFLGVEEDSQGFDVD
jgi:c-di-GMP-binding flagellar brake protein YcgR